MSLLPLDTNNEASTLGFNPTVPDAISDKSLQLTPEDMTIAQDPAMRERVETADADYAQDQANPSEVSNFSQSDAEAQEGYAPAIAQADAVGERLMPHGHSSSGGLNSGGGPHIDHIEESR